jgi:hypothetical protein
MKLNVTDWSKLGQSLLDLIKAGVAAGLLLLNWLSAALSNGTIQLPYAALTLPVLTLLISQLDSYFINWQSKEATQ